MKAHLVVVLSVLLLAPPSWATSLSYVFKPANNPDEQQIAKLLQTNQDLMFLKRSLDAQYDLDTPVVIQFGADDGPLYDSESNTVMMPYEFVHDIEYYLESASASFSERSAEFINDVLVHTLLHEFAHALIYLFEVPVVGKEEDAADSFASVFIIEQLPKAHRRMTNAAQMFLLESRDHTPTQEDYAGEHSLDTQRYYATLCHLYGSDPEKYEGQFSKTGFSGERAELCADDYELLATAWERLHQGFIWQ